MVKQARQQKKAGENGEGKQNGNQLGGRKNKSVLGGLSQALRTGEQKKEKEKQQAEKKKREKGLCTAASFRFGLRMNGNTPEYTWFIP